MPDDDVIEREFGPRRLSRRDVVALSAGAPAALWAPGTRAATSDTPVSGGTLTLGLGGGSTTDTLSPLTADDSVMIATTFGLYNGLIENTADNRQVPELAESYEARPGARSWIFNLRRGVTFTNGKSFDADDAIYSLNLHRNAATSSVASTMGSITDIRKLGPAQIEVILSSGDADFLSVLSDYHVMMVPAGFTDWSKPIGTGAYTVDRFDPGARIRLKKKPGTYWKDGRGHLDGVDITVIADTGARMNALISGQVDAINRADPRTVSRIEKSPHFEIVRAAGGWFPIMAMQVDHDPYANLELRQAMKVAIDRDQMIKVLFNGYGSLGNDHPIPRSDPYFNSSLEQLPFDPDKARFHLQKAGLENPVIVLKYSDAAFNGAADMAGLFQSRAGQVGIPVTTAKAPSDGYFSRVWLVDPFVTSYWGGRPSATSMLSVAYGTGAPWNETHWSDPAFETLLANAKAETDEAKRKPMIWDMQAILRDRSGSLIPCFRDWLDAHSTRVGGHTPHSGFDMDNGRIAEQAFIKAKA